MINSSKIKGRMRELGIIQKDIATLLNISAPTVSQKINGVRPMNLDEACALAEFLSISKEEFGNYFFGH